MRHTFDGTNLKLTLTALLSSLLLLLAPMARAHEVQPTIGDFAVVEGQLELTLQINLEAFLAGIDLDAVDDTNNAPNAADYDTWRGLTAAEVAERAPVLLPGWNALPMLAAGDVALPLKTRTLQVPEDVDLALPRLSKWTLIADLPAEARNITINWPNGAGAMVLRQQGVEAPFTGYLSGGESSGAISLAGGGAQTPMQAFMSYIPVGFDHILPKGLDHILFVLGLFFLSTRLRPLIWQISAFTLAHTVTLALGALGWVSVPGEIVEPLIAASIVYVAVENVFSSKLNAWRPLVIFGFGLLHGLGFASVLGEFGLPEAQFIPALIGFNVGVELGQLTVIALAFAAVGWAAHHTWYRSRIAVPASCVIAAVGAYWFVERVFL